MNEQEPISDYELQKARDWWLRWNSLKYLLLALRKLLLWIVGVGVGLSAFVDAIQKLIGGGGTPR